MLNKRTKKARIFLTQQSHKTAIVIAVILILLTILLGVMGHSAKTVQPQSSSSQSDKNFIFTDVASYQIPSGWKVKENNAYSISYISPDYKESPRPEIIQGAEIRIIKMPRRLDTNLVDYILSGNLPPRSPTYSISDIHELSIGNQKAAAIFTSWEASSLQYYISKDTVVWRVDFISAPYSSTLAEFQKNRYYPIMQGFLQSITFNR